MTAPGSARQGPTCPPLLRRLAACILVLLVASCTNGASSPGGTLPAGHGGTLTVAMTQTNGSPYPSGGYDPQVTTDSAFLETDRCCLFRTLMGYNGHPTSGGGATPRPDLASGSPSVSRDGLTWTFMITPGIHYAPPLQHTEVAAEDFIRGLERALQPVPARVAKALQIACAPGAPCALSSFYAQFFTSSIAGAAAYADGTTSTISGLEAPNTHTLIVRLTHPDGTDWRQP